jgi:nitroimidazol reductase NimA-like FMN-containing flavoprotein (pyridoxamine 5'-phosphate oxidase superfamily)
LTELSFPAKRAFEEGGFCAVAAVTPNGPHCTPLVYALSGDRVWLTTSRRSIKARAWLVNPCAAGLVRNGDVAITFTGTAHLFDLLDAGTWPRTVADAPRLVLASTKFSRRNARFFAGYAIDAGTVPFAWTPPGRVFVGIEVERSAILDADGVQERWGPWEGEVGSGARFRNSRGGGLPFTKLPLETREAIGSSGTGVLALAGRAGPVVLPVRWLADEGAVFAALPGETLSLSQAGPQSRVALMVDRTSSWRARDMVGAMVQGTGSLYTLDALENGSSSMKTILRSVAPGADSLVRISVTRLVWWHGWSSGSADVP